MKTLDVICPVFNEAAVIGDFHHVLRQQLDALQRPLSDAHHLRRRPEYGRDGRRRAALCARGSVADGDRPLRPLRPPDVARRRHGSLHRRLVRDDGLRSRASAVGDSRSCSRRANKASTSSTPCASTRRRCPRSSGSRPRSTTASSTRMTDLSVQDGSADFRLISGKVRDVFKHALREQNQFLRGLISWVGFRSTFVVFRSQTRKAGRVEVPAAERCSGSRRLASFRSAGSRCGWRSMPDSSRRWLALATLAYHLYAWVRYANLPQGWTTLALLISIIGSVQLLDPRDHRRVPSGSFSRRSSDGRCTSSIGRSTA